MKHPSAFLAALAVPGSAAAHSGTHSGMGLIEGIEHFLGPDHVIGLAVAVALAAVVAFGRIRTRRAPRHTRRRTPRGTHEARQQ